MGEKLSNSSFSPPLKPIIGIELDLYEIGYLKNLFYFPIFFPVDLIVEISLII